MLHQEYRYRIANFEQDLVRQNIDVQPGLGEGLVTENGETGPEYLGKKVGKVILPFNLEDALKETDQVLSR